jgi:hypothetical protein
MIKEPSARSFEFSDFEHASPESVEQESALA